MILGFTGTSQGMTQAQRATVRYLFNELTVLHHGDCVGADAEAHQIARELCAWVVGHPPINSKARAFCDFDELLPAKPYLTRNCDIVAAAEGVIAAPKDYLWPNQLSWSRHLDYRALCQASGEAVVARVPGWDVQGGGEGVTFYLRYRVHATGITHERSFDSALLRGLCIISLTAWAEVLGMWES